MIIHDQQLPINQRGVSWVTWKWFCFWKLLGFWVWLYRNLSIQLIQFASGTVDGRNPASVDMVKYPIIYKVYRKHTRWWSPDFWTINSSEWFLSILFPGLISQVGWGKSKHRWFVSRASDLELEMMVITLRKRNIAPKNGGFQVRNLLLQVSIFRGYWYVIFRECMIYHDLPRCYWPLEIYHGSPPNLHKKEIFMANHLCF